jgi:hypothetical protein
MSKAQKKYEEWYKTSSHRIYDLAKTLGHTLYISNTAMDWIYSKSDLSDSSLLSIIKKTCFENGKPKMCRTKIDDELRILRRKLRIDKDDSADSFVRLDTMIKKLDALEYKKFMNNC